jgi:hypothetical protein
VLLTPDKAHLDPDVVFGKWHGVLPAEGLLVVFHIKLGGTSTSDSPNQNSYWLPMGVTVNGSESSLLYLQWARASEEPFKGTKSREPSHKTALTNW